MDKGLVEELHIQPRTVPELQALIRRLEAKRLQRKARRLRWYSA